jgi:hypothetical protein
VHLSVAGISRACVHQPERMLVDLLARTIRGVGQFADQDASRVERPVPRQAPKPQVADAESPAGVWDTTA